MTDKVKGKVRIYACGGGGLNIGQRMEKHRGKDEVGFAISDIAYIDTSRSNLRSSISADHCYLLDGLDGSGKVRAENHEEIANHTREILQKFKPMDLNIVVSMAAGGSGSVIAPLITSELLAADKPVVVIAVGSADTKLDAQNSLKTIKSYESISKRRQTPVVMYYVENSPQRTREEVDAMVVEVMASLCLLFSRENRELDSRDLYNFLRYTKVTSFPAQLVSLSIHSKDNNLSAHAHLGNIISVATLAAEGSSVSLTPMPEVQYSGFVPADTHMSVTSDLPLHFIVSDGIIPQVYEDFAKLIKEQDEAAAARLAKRGNKSMLSASDDVQDTGLVL